LTTRREILEEDVRDLARLGYAQQLSGESAGPQSPSRRIIR